MPRVDFRLWAASLRALMQKSDVCVCGGWGVIHSHSICNCELLEREGDGTGQEERKSGGARRQKSRQTWLANEDPQQCVCAAVHAWCDARSGVCQVHAARGEADGDRLRTTTVHEVEARIECAAGGRGSVVALGNVREGGG